MTHRTRPSGLRRAGALLVLALLLVGGAACVGTAGQTAPTPTRGGEATNASAADAHYPRTLNTPHGDVTIPAKPERIVALSPTSAGELLALGVKPYRVAQDPATLKTTYPWLAKQLADISDAQLNSDRHVNVEAVAALQPDLIIGDPFRLADGTLFRQLNRIAPTISAGQPSQINVDWDTRLRYTADAVDATEQAEELITDIRKEYAAAAKNGQDLKGRTYTWASFDGEQYGMGNGTLLELFGLEPAKSQDNSNTKTLSVENVSELDADLVAVWPATDKDRIRLEKDPTFQSLPAVRKGAVFYATLADADALNSPEPLAIRWFLNRITPTIEKVAG